MQIPYEKHIDLKKKIRNHTLHKISPNKQRAFAHTPYTISYTYDSARLNSASRWK